MQSWDSDRDVPVEIAGVTPAAIAEGGAYGESDPTIDVVQFRAHKYGFLTKVSEELLTDNQSGFNQFFSDKAGEGMADLEATYHAIGTGVTQPKGIATEATLTFTAANAASFVTADARAMRNGVAPQYRKRGWYLVSDTAYGDAEVMLDEAGELALKPGQSIDSPDILFRNPIEIVVDLPAPAALETGGSVLFGDPQKYLIADRPGLFIRVLNELYSENGQVGFRVSRRSDAHITDLSAWVRMEHPA